MRKQFNIRSRRQTSVPSDSGKTRNYIAAAFWSIFTIWIANTWWPEIIPFETFGEPFWGTRGNPGMWVGAVWPIFVWGIGVNLVTGYARNTMNTSNLRRFLQQKEPSASEILTSGTLISLWAGVMEELAFRWLLYLSAIVSLVFMNWLWGTVFLYIALSLIALWLTVAIGKGSSDAFPAVMTLVVSAAGIIWLGMAGGVADPIQWFYEGILVPIADWTSFGKMHDCLYQSHSWAIGAGVVSANAFFRDGHKYQGLFGVINAWFGGLVFFWLMFTYGLVAAMVCHFLYDFLIFATAALMRLGR